MEGYRLSEIIANYRQRTELPSYILVVDWFEQALRTLAAIHATGRRYCSVGPDRIVVGADDEVRIDEGTAALDLGPQNAACAAPEVLAGRAVDQRSDLYGLGAAFYELLTLCRPGTFPDPPSSINITVPKAFDALLLRLLATAPENRYASAEEVLADLAALRRSPQTRAPALVAPPGQPVRPAGVPRAAMVTAGAIIGAVGGAIAGWLLNSFLPATIVVGGVVGGIIGVFSNPRA